MSNSENKTSLFTNQSTEGYTPRQLINFHINHPELPITDKDIDNLISGSNVEKILQNQYDVTTLANYRAN